MAKKKAAKTPGGIGVGITPTSAKGGIVGNGKPTKAKAAKKKAAKAAGGIVGNGKKGSKKPAKKKATFGGTIIDNG